MVVGVYIVIYMMYTCECMFYLQPKNKDKDKEKDKGQTEEDKNKQDGEKLGCGRVIPIKQVEFTIVK